MSFEAVVYRAVGYETPLWGFANASAGRWNRTGSWPAQYLSLHPMTPWAEQLRNLDMRTPDEARATRVPVWALRITLNDDPAEIDFDHAPAHSIDAADLVSDDWSACQALAGGFHGAGVESIIVPSAALPGTKNLVVLQPRAVVDYHQLPVDEVDFPAAMVALDGRCPEGLWDHVHYQGVGAAHAGLDAFLRGDSFEFVQPDVSAASPAA